MKALAHLQKHICSLQRIEITLKSLLNQPAPPQEKPSNHHLKNELLTSLGFIIQNYIDYSQEQYMSRIFSKIQEYENNSGEILHLSTKQIKDSTAPLLGENLKLLKNKFFADPKKELHETPIILPNRRDDLNRSAEISFKENRFKGSQSNRSFQQSHESFYSAVDSQNFRGTFFKNLAPKKSSPKKVLNQESLEKFESIDGQSFLKLPAKNAQKEKQAVRNFLKLNKQVDIKICIEKKDSKGKESNKKPVRDSKQIEKALLEIMYGADLFPFIKFYMKFVKKDENFSTPKANKFILSEKKSILSDNMSEEKENQKDMLDSLSKRKQNALMKFLTKGNSFDELTADSVIEAKFQKLVITCIDTILHSMKAMSRLVPAGELTGIIEEIIEKELNVYKKPGLDSQLKEIDSMCKKVKELMREYRHKFSEVEKRVFNKRMQIKTVVV